MNNKDEKMISVEIEYVTNATKTVSIPAKLLREAEGDTENSVLERICDFTDEDVVRADWTPEEII